MNYFVYNGVRSTDMGVRIMSKNVFSAPKYDLTFQAIPGRNGDLINPSEGFYVPSLYNVEYNSDGTIKSFEPKYSDVPRRVEKRIIKDLNKSHFPTKPIMPFVEVVHDRIMLETFRGCIR